MLHRSRVGKARKGGKGEIRITNPGHQLPVKVVLDNGIKPLGDQPWKTVMDSMTEEERERWSTHILPNTVALELYDFADAIIHNREPEVDGQEAFKSTALCLSIFESAWLGEPVKVKDIENGKIENYQREINERLGI